MAGYIRLQPTEQARAADIMAMALRPLYRRQSTCAVVRAETPLATQNKTAIGHPRGGVHPDCVIGTKNVRV